jgi:response regulator PhyR-like protein
MAFMADLESSTQRGQNKSTVEDISPAIVVLLPRLKRYASQLTRDAAAADDLVQETLVRGMENIRLWRQGTDLRVAVHDPAQSVCEWRPPSGAGVPGTARAGLAESVRQMRGDRPRAQPRAG